MPKQEQKAMKYCPLSVATLALLWFSAAHAQTENTSTWPTHNRHVALNLGQQQHYRELDTQASAAQQYREVGLKGMATTTALKTKTDHQSHWNKS